MWQKNVSKEVKTAELRKKVYLSEAEAHSSSTGASVS